MALVLTELNRSTRLCVIVLTTTTGGRGRGFGGLLTKRFDFFYGMVFGACFLFFKPVGNLTVQTEMNRDDGPGGVELGIPIAGFFAACLHGFEVEFLQ